MTQFLTYIQENYIVIGCILIATYIALKLVELLWRVQQQRYLLKQEWVFFELIPPKNNTKSAGATEQLFSVLHGLNVTRPLKDKLLGRKVVFSPEVDSTNDGGVKFIAKIPKAANSIFKQNMVSFLPELEVNEIPEPEAFKATYQKVVEFKQKGHFAYPLRSQEALNENDPIAYLTGAMSKLNPTEGVAFQIVLSPISSNVARGVTRRLHKKDDLISYLNRPTGSPVFAVIGLLISVIGWFLDLFTLTFSEPSYKKTGHHPANDGSANNTDDLTESIKQKIAQPMFEANIRVLVASKNQKALSERVRAVKTSLASYSTREQALHARVGWPITQQLRAFAFTHRLPSIYSKKACVLSAKELASIYHFPFTQTAKPENLHKSLSRTLPATISLKNPKNKLDVIIGENVHQGVTTPIGLTSQEREKHMYVIGGTGNGKTTLLQYAIIQDIQKGKGVGVIDPHGDVSEYLLKHMPEDRIKDVVYFNPYDIEYPIGLNLTELDPKAQGVERLRLKTKTVAVVVEAMRKVFSEGESGGSRIEGMLRNSLLTAMTVENATLFTVLKLIRNPSYRKTVVSKLKDERLKDFWNQEMAKAGGMQEVSMTKGITNKLDRFASDPVIERIMSQEKSTIDFGEILDGKILICNLAKGKIGGDNSSFLGTIILSQIQMAAEARVLKDEDNRKPFYLYVDEFQNFATSTFTDMVAEARKYGLFLTMAEQTTSQQDRNIVETLLGNIGVMVCFRSGNPADERMLLPFFGTFLNQGEINNLDAYNFYARIVAVKSQEPVSGKTLIMPDKGDKNIAQRVIDASRARYAKLYVEPESEQKPATPPEQKTDAPLGKPSVDYHKKNQ